MLFDSYFIVHISPQVPVKLMKNHKVAQIEDIVS